MKGVWRQRNTGCILALIMSRMMVMMIWSHHYQHQTGRALRQKTGGEHPKPSYVSSSCAGLPRPPACARLPRPPPSAYMRLHWAACGMEERGGAGGAAQPAGAKESSASTGAATEVGAGRSNKHRRTYWEPCAEGKEARRQWAPAFEAKVKGNEEAADAYWDGLPKRQSTRERAWVLGEHYNMTKGDRESRIWMTIDAMHEQLRWYRSQELRVEIPPAAFKCGQAVLQWWAPWMKDAEETPASQPPSCFKRNIIGTSISSSSSSSPCLREPPLAQASAATVGGAMSKWKVVGGDSSGASQHAAPSSQQEGPSC